MPMNKQQKATYVAELETIASSALSLVAVYYSGIDSKSMDILRAQARKADVYVKVSKNTLTRMVLEKSEYASVASDMKGHVLLFFSMKEPNAAAKIVQDLVKKHNFVQVCAIGLAGAKVEAAQLDQIASLPNHEQAISMLMGTILAPVRCLATAVQETYAGLARAASQIADKKSSQD